MDQLPLLLNRKQAARHLGRSEKKVLAWTRAGLLPTFVDPESGRVLYPLPALERWAAEHQAA